MPPCYFRGTSKEELQEYAFLDGFDYSQSCLPEHKQLEVFFFTETALTPTVVSQEEDLMIMVLTETYDHLSPSQKSLYSYTCSNKADGNLTGEHHYHEKRPETATV